MSETEQVPAGKRPDTEYKGFFRAVPDRVEMRLLAQKLGAHPEFLILMAAMLRIHIAKGSDYSGPGDAASNLRRATRLGLTPLDGTLTRMMDKVARIETLVTKRRRGEGPAVKDESLRDTFIDLANYSLWCVVFLDEEAPAELLGLRGEK